MRTNAIATFVILGLAVPALRPGPLFGQSPAPDSAAATYMERYQEIVRLAPVNGRVAEVSRLVLERDVGRLVFERGRLMLLSPVGGRTVGLLFRGEGRFTVAPPLEVERAELRRFADSATLSELFREAVLLFSDSTMEQLRGLTFGPGVIPGDAGDAVRDLVNSLKGEREGSFDGDVMGPLLNGRHSGFFLARIERNRGGAVLFQINPDLVESVQLYRPVSRIRWGAPWAVVTQFPSRRVLPGTAGAWHYRERLRIPSYRMDVTLTEAFSANLVLAARADLVLAADEPVGPWLLFRLHPKLDVDSARWGDGRTAPVFKANEGRDLWVRAGARLQAGDTLSLTLYYRGDMIDRFDNFFFVDPGAAWYPVNGQGGTHSTFDLTFRSPRRYPLVSIGERTDSSTAGNVRITRWVTRSPTQFASFNLGLFDEYHVQHEGAPPLDVYISDEAHDLMRRRFARSGYVLPQQRRMRENVAADISNSLKLFTALFGEPPYQRFSVTEIPYGAGVSFPGLIHLSWGTFQNTSLDGFDEFFRAHEAAHQWWGNGVRPASYRDAWLAEGMATFYGLWYLQATRRRNNEYNRFLDQYRADINATRDVGPIWNGFRNATAGVEQGYHVVVYEKGAWVFHMLRVMLTDLSTLRSDRFTAMMQNFYQTFTGQAATTADFQVVVERYMGAPMDWFFEQWIRGTAVPTYRVAWRAEPAEGGRFRVRLRITQENVPATFRMPVLVAADLGGDRTARFRVQVHGGQTEYVSPLLPSEPREVVFNDMRSVLAEVRTERW